jgi:glycosyltransferase involved in cell wall biosynthesis
MESGYEVVVLTTTPHYNVLKQELDKQHLTKRLFGLFYTSNFNGIKVYHVTQRKFKNTILRIFGFIYWHFISFIIALYQSRIDIILSPSPPLTIGFFNIIIGKLKNARVIYNVQEIYPDLLIEGGGLKSKILINSLKKLERFVYNKSDKVTTIDKVFRDTIINRFDDQSNLKVIPNFVDMSVYKPINEFYKDLNDYFPKTNALKVMYAGNIGYAQDWIPLINTARELNDSNVEFFVIGEGVMKQYLEEEIKKHALKKIHIIPYQSRALMSSIIAYSDLQFIFMAPSVEGFGLPSKVYTIMACGKPLLVCSGENTPIVNFLEGKECSYIITEKDNQFKTEKLVHFLKEIDKTELQQKGLNGMKYISAHYSKEVVTTQYVNLANSLIHT